MIDPGHLKLHQCGWEQCSPDWSWKLPRKRYVQYDLWFVLDGEGEIHQAETRVPIGPGDAILYSRGQDVSATQNRRKRLTVSFTLFDLDHDELLQKWRTSGHGVVKIQTEDINFTGTLLNRARAEFYGPGPKHNAATWFASALLEINRCFETQQGSGVPTHLIALREKILRSPQEPWTVDQMAATADVSPSHLARQFRFHFGHTPHAFLMQTRIRVAQSQLTFTNLPIQTIADQLGYPDPFTFSKQFKRVTGVSPRQWRRLPR